MGGSLAHITHTTVGSVTSTSRRYLAVGAHTSIMIEGARAPRMIHARAILVDPAARMWHTQRETAVHTPCMHQGKRQEEEEACAVAVTGAAGGWVVAEACGKRRLYLHRGPQGDDAGFLVPCYQIT